MTTLSVKKTFPDIQESLFIYLFFLSEVFPAVGTNVPDEGLANAISIWGLVQEAKYHSFGLNICSHYNPSLSFQITIWLQLTDLLRYD